MNHPAHVELARRLLGRLAEAGAAPGRGVRTGEVPASEYASPDRFERERSRVFSRVPSPVAHTSELAGPGACLAVEVAGVSVLLVRGDDGTLSAFRNACRHRSTRLVPEGAPCQKKSIVCPYHAWTYDLRGRLLHVPHADSFRGGERSRTELVAAHVAEREGLVWASLAPFDIDAHLAPIAGELAASGVSRGTLYRRTTRDVQGNWKLVIDAFLDGYHIRHLHKDSVGRFFADALYEAERAGEHVRAVTARRTLRGVAPASLESSELRELVTPSYHLFPNTIVVLHPDYASVLLATPVAADRTRFSHWMIVPEVPRSQADEQHWEKSFALVDEGVFSSEDLFVVEAMQRGIATGANDRLLFGELEHAVLWFHESLERALSDGRN